MKPLSKLVASAVVLMVVLTAGCASLQSILEVPDPLTAMKSEGLSYCARLTEHPLSQEYVRLLWERQALIEERSNPLWEGTGFDSSAKTLTRARDVLEIDESEKLLLKKMWDNDDRGSATRGDPAFRYGSMYCATSLLDTPYEVLFTAGDPAVKSTLEEIRSAISAVEDTTQWRRVVNAAGEEVRQRPAPLEQILISNYNMPFRALVWEGDNEFLDNRAAAVVDNMTSLQVAWEERLTATWEESLYLQAVADRSQTPKTCQEFIRANQLFGDLARLGDGYGTVRIVRGDEIVVTGEIRPLGSLNYSGGILRMTVGDDAVMIEGAKVEVSEEISFLGQYQEDSEDLRAICIEPHSGGEGA